jgi:hypothetical protein
MNASYDSRLPATTAGIASSLVSTIAWRTVGSFPASCASSGSSVGSMNSSRSSAWLMMNSTCSGNSRGLTVCSTAPMHETAK